MPVTGLTATQAHELVAAGRGVLVDTRDARLFDNAHAAGALSLPLATIQAAQGRPPAGALPPDRTLILYCARSEEHTSELQSPCNLVCRLLLEKKKTNAARC